MPYQSDITASWNARQIALANSRKITTLTRRVKKAEGELKCYHIDASFEGASSVPNAAIGFQEVSLISQGDGAHQRDGNVCHIKSITVRGFMSAPHLDVYLVQSLNGQTPQYSNYTAAPYGYLLTDQRYEFRVLKYLKNWGTGWDAPSSYPLQHTTAYRVLNIPIYFQGTSTQGIRNTLYLVVKNNTGALQSARFQIEVKFKDG